MFRHTAPLCSTWNNHFKIAISIETVAPIIAITIGRVKKCLSFFWLRNASEQFFKTLLAFTSNSLLNFCKSFCSSVMFFPMFHVEQLIKHYIQYHYNIKVSSIFSLACFTWNMHKKMNLLYM